jgi:uncharacterized protein involved in response to NO
MASLMTAAQPQDGGATRRCNKSNRKNRRAAAGSYWKLVAAGEPFRLLFPVGALLGVYGVMMWPLYIWNITGTYPGQWHARIMVEGFLTAFVIGFLGTALPRLLEVPRMTLLETLGFCASVLGVGVLHARGETMWGDQLFFVTLCGLLGTLGMRGFLFRKDVPPPAFVLVMLGMACALFGSGVQVVMDVSPSLLPEWCFPLSKLLLYQGYLIFPIMGIGAFLLPRFFGLPNRQSFPESLALPPGWMQGAMFALLCGGMVMTGFVLEARGEPGWGNGLRAAGVLLYFLREVPVHRAGWGGGTLAFGLRLALFSIPAAYLTMAIWPDHSFALLHLLFITGFSLLTLIVASRVILGHSGQSEKFRATLWPVLTLTALLFLAMLTRVSADWMSTIRLSHYAYAAVSWAIGVIVWGVTILPGIRQADEE